MAAYFRDDEAALRELITPDVVVITRPDQPDVRESSGFEGFLASTREWTEAWEGWSFEILRVFDEGDLVFVDAFQTARGASSGVPIEGSVMFVCTVVDARIARLRMFASEQEARETMGLLD